nr:hypothetical protein [Tanacetum cinerariifolium]
GPVGIEVALEGAFVEGQLAQAAGHGAERDKDVAQRHAQVAQHRGVGEVALEARNGQLGGKVFEQGVGHAQ